MEDSEYSEDPEDSMYSENLRYLEILRGPKLLGGLIRKLKTKKISLYNFFVNSESNYKCLSVVRLNHLFHCLVIRYVRI